MLSNQKRQAICIKVAQILREERLGKGVSMTRLAERAGVSQQMVSYIERGMRNPTLDVLLRVSGALELQLDDVLGQAYASIEGRSAKPQKTIGRRK
jgi:transcriptional regulator with XRE-family HTH domain